MTTEAAARLYEAQHLNRWADKGWAVHNPHNRPVEELPVIYGFNNGGSRDWWHAQLIAEDGTGLGGHLCSSEGYMPHDLGVLEGSRPDRHEYFRDHYPDGYRMEFVSYREVEGHAPLKLAFERNRLLAEATAQVGTHPQGGDAKQAPGDSLSDAVLEEDAPQSSPNNTPSQSNEQ